MWEDTESPVIEKMTEFKVYRHEGCLIYTAKNKNFLEGFAKGLSKLSLTEKSALHEKKVSVGGVTYKLVHYGKNKIMLVTGGGAGKKAADLVLVEE